MRTSITSKHEVALQNVTLFTFAQENLNYFISVTLEQSVGSNNGFPSPTPGQRQYFAELLSDFQLFSVHSNL